MSHLVLDSTAEPARLRRHWRGARRLRFDVPGLRHNPNLASAIEAELRRLPGVESAVANLQSGRLLVCYSPDDRFLERLVAHAPIVSRFAPAATAAWHALTVADVLQQLDSDRHGLRADEARRRCQRYGPNAAGELRSRSSFDILAAQVANLPTSLLLGSSALSTLLGELLDATAILGVVGMDALIGYSIERGNEDLLASWRQLQAGQAHVMRDGALARVPAVDLVPGDVLFLRADDTVPADARVVDPHRLACDESMLTGESEPQEKSSEPVDAAAPIAERASMLYAGTRIVSGRCRAVVTATGRDSEMARIGRLLDEEEAPQTPLERRLEHLSNRFAIAGVGAGAASALLGLLRGRPIGEWLRTGAALGVAAVPEGLPVVATAALARSMQRMRERGMVVRRLASAETLGGVTVICSDKTGTLTENEMRLEVLEVEDGVVDLDTLRAEGDGFGESATFALAAAILNSDVDVHHRGEVREIFGSSTEAALVRAGQAAGLSRTSLRQRYPRRRLLERGAGRHYVISAHDHPQGGGIAFVKGAPEQVLALCSQAMRRPLRAAKRRRWLRRNEELAADGLRVLALAWRRVDDPSADVAESDFAWIGLVGLRDPVRPGAAEALRTATRAGIRTLILTGDQRRTAEAAARAVGLSGHAIDGAEAARRLAAGDASFLDGAAVLSRVTPADKLAIVRVLRARGEIVAMAGDGVNDAPALKAADVGIAVGARASDLTRHAADVVLESEDLRAILAAVGEGRIVQDNLRRAIHYLATTNLAESVVVVGATAAGLPSPLNAMQLLWINLLSDTIPALALALEPGRPDVLSRGPMPPDAPLIDADAMRRIVRDGMVLSAIGLGSHLIGGPGVAFATMASAELGYTFLCRAPESPASPRFTRMMGLAAGLQTAALVVPPVRVLLGLPSTPSWLEALGAAAGMAVPWAMAPDAVIVRRGLAAATQSAPRRIPSVPLRRLA